MRVKRSSRGRSEVKSKSRNPLANCGLGLIAPPLLSTAGRKPVASVKLEQGAFLRPASRQSLADAFSPPHGDDGRRPGRCGGSVAWERSDGFAPARHDRRAAPRVNAPGILRRGLTEPICRFHGRICFCCCCLSVAGAQRPKAHSCPIEHPAGLRRPMFPRNASGRCLHVLERESTEFELATGLLRGTLSNQPQLGWKGGMK